MNNGAFGENFPYSNFHDLNMDWIIQIAKDFLDQYTHIQEIISDGEQGINDATTEGLNSLQEKADALEALLQQWYDTHSADIANALTQALADFATEAEEIAENTIESIPVDYTSLYNKVMAIQRAIEETENAHKTEFFTSNLYAYQHEFIKDHTYKIIIKFDTYESWYTDHVINASLMNNKYIISKDATTDLVETITDRTEHTNSMGEIDILYKPANNGNAIAYYLGATVIPHTITIEDITVFNKEDYIAIPKTMNGQLASGFFSSKLFRDTNYIVTISNNNNTSTVFELTALNNYAISPSATLERIFGGVITENVENAPFSFSLGTDYTMSAINGIASGIDGIDFTFYVPTEVYNLYNDFVLNNGNIVGYKYFGLPKKEDVYPFYTIENIDIKEGKDYILHVSGSGDVYIKRLAFSTFNGTRDDYDFVQEGIYDTSEIYFKNSYATVFHCTGNAQSMMLLIDQPNQEVSLSIYEYVKADYGFNSIYVNPIFNQRDLSDPTVWDGEDGYYYCLGSPWTNTNYHILRSTDLINWEDTGAYPFDESITSLFTNYDLGVWAPQVKKIENNWLMYISLASTSNGTAIAVCKSLNPYGKFTLVRILTNSQTSGITDSIDPCVIAGNDNHMYLFWGSQSGIYRLQLTDDGMNVATGSTPTLVAGTSDTSGGRAKIFEGAYLYFRNGYWYMFVSTGEFDKPTYTLKVVRSTSITGTFTNKSGQLATDGYAETVISSASATDIFNGPGHCGEIFPDRTGKTFIFYHSHDKSTQYNLTYGIFTIKSRALFIQEIKWDETNWPYVDAGYPSDSGNAPII